MKPNVEAILAKGTKLFASAYANIQLDVPSAIVVRPALAGTSDPVGYMPINTIGHGVPTRVQVALLLL